MDQADHFIHVTVALARNSQRYGQHKENTTPKEGRGRPNAEPFGLARTAEIIKDTFGLERVFISAICSLESVFWNN